jgi:hypothetical protein
MWTLLSLMPIKGDTMTKKKSDKQKLRTITEPNMSRAGTLISSEDDLPKYL